MFIVLNPVTSLPRLYAKEITQNIVNSMLFTMVKKQKKFF